LCVRQLPPEGLGLDVVRADALAVELDDRDQLPVAALELWVAVDRHLLELEPELLLQRAQLRVGPLAEMTAVGLVEDDPLSGYG
jgi:hypothetical protein